MPTIEKLLSTDWKEKFLERSAEQLKGEPPAHTLPKKVHSISSAFMPTIAFLPTIQKVASKVESNFNSSDQSLSGIKVLAKINFCAFQWLFVSPRIILSLSLSVPGVVRND